MRRSITTVTIDSGKRNVAYENGIASVASTYTLIVERLFGLSNNTNSTAAATNNDDMKADDSSGIGKDDDGAGMTITTQIDGSLGILLLGVILLDSS
jgi:hypothetical protein